MKANKLITRLMTGTLAALGFVSCDDNLIGGDIVEYGTPSVNYRVKGTVTDKDGNPLNNIRVTLRNSWDGQSSTYYDDTLYTDQNGKFDTGIASSTSINKQKVIFEDIDGEQNGGAFKADSTDLKDMDITQTKGKNGWFNGEFECKVEKKLKREGE